jgi:hypothetical protein
MLKGWKIQRIISKKERNVVVMKVSESCERKTPRIHHKQRRQSSLHKDIVLHTIPNQNTVIHDKHSASRNEKHCFKHVPDSAMAAGWDSRNVEICSVSALPQHTYSHVFKSMHSFFTKYSAYRRNMAAPASGYNSMAARRPTYAAVAQERLAATNSGGWLVADLQRFGPAGAHCA